MASFAGRSLDLMEELAAESGDAFDMRHFGYDFVSEPPDRDMLALGGKFEVRSAPASTIDLIDPAKSWGTS